MNTKTLVRLSNTIGIIAIILLVYWVFIFISVTVFGLKVFKGNLSESYYWSIIGILALMFGSLILNVMLNLTRIAEKHNLDKVEKYSSRKFGWVIGLSFPILLAFLFFGDFVSAKKKEARLIESAKSVVEMDAKKTDQLVEYAFTKGWINETANTLQLYASTDVNFPTIRLIAKDEVDGISVYMGFNHYNVNPGDTSSLVKRNFIHKTTQEEREYLSKVFSGKSEDVRFNSRNGIYELFYPLTRGNKKIVLYFSDFQGGNYGSISK
jgi:hypothetical protein